MLRVKFIMFLFGINKNKNVPLSLKLIINLLTYT
jgi:hypothetical protein